MPRLICPGWLALGLVLVAAGCSALGASPRAATAIPQVPSSTQVAQVETPTLFTTPVGIPAETNPAATATAHSMAETSESVTVTTEKPHVSAVGTSVENEVAPMETPTVATMAEGEDETPGVGEAGLDQGPTEEQLELLAGLQSYGPGPELHSDDWLNSEPLKLADLRGSVVMVEFWTFG